MKVIKSSGHVKFLKKIEFFVNDLICSKSFSSFNLVKLTKSTFDSLRSLYILSNSSLIPFILSKSVKKILFFILSKISFLSLNI